MFMTDSICNFDRPPCRLEVDTRARSPSKIGPLTLRTFLWIESSMICTGRRLISPSMLGVTVHLHTNASYINPRPSIHIEGRNQTRISERVRGSASHCDSRSNMPDSFITSDTLADQSHVLGHSRQNASVTRCDG